MYNLEINQKHAETIVKALDLYSRIHCLQLSEIANIILWTEVMPKDIYGEEIPAKNVHKFKDAVDDAKSEFLGVPSNGSQGIGSDNVGDTARVAYDIQQVMRYKLATDKDPDPMFRGVDHNPPMRYSEENLPTMKKDSKHKADTMRLLRGIMAEMSNLTAGNVSHKKASLEASLGAAIYLCEKRAEKDDDNPSSGRGTVGAGELV